MPWSKSYTTTDAETGEKTTASHKTDDEGHVSDFIQGMEKDADGGHHGHAWNLNKELSDDGEDPIGGRDVKEPPEKT